jgi:acyl carrier protein
MNIEGLCSHLDELFELAPGTIHPADRVQDMPNWDSLKFLGLISLIDSEYNVRLTPKAVIQSQSVQDIWNHIAAGGSKAAA